MLDSTSLIVTTERSLVAVLREQLRCQKVAGRRMIVSDNVEEACSLLKSVRARVVVVHLEPERVGYEEIDQILWVASTLPRRTPLLVVAERYLVEQATTLYRMGVSDYVSRSHHLDVLGSLVASYLPHAPAAALGSEKKEKAAEKPARVAASGKPSAALPARTV
jgi:DNA-binding NtrC family response regulator